MGGMATTTGVVATDDTAGVWSLEEFEGLKTGQQSHPVVFHVEFELCRSQSGFLDYFFLTSFVVGIPAVVMLTQQGGE